MATITDLGFGTLEEFSDSIFLFNATSESIESLDKLLELTTTLRRKIMKPSALIVSKQTKAPLNASILMAISDTFEEIPELKYSVFIEPISSSDESLLIDSTNERGVKSHIMPNLDMAIDSARKELSNFIH